MAEHRHAWTDAPEWHWGVEGSGTRTAECFPCRGLLIVRDARCIFDGCVATWEHYHGGFPGGYTNPNDPDGAPIAFVGPNPEPGAVRDYNGAVLR